jgi:hypothetical protein
MTLRELASKIGESEAFLRRVMASEGDLADVVKIRLISDVAWATGRWVSISVAPKVPIVAEVARATSSVEHRSEFSELDERTRNTLIANRIVTADQLTRFTRQGLLRLPGIGAGGLARVVVWLDERGRSLAAD